MATFEKSSVKKSIIAIRFFVRSAKDERKIFLDDKSSWVASIIYEEFGKKRFVVGFNLGSLNNWQVLYYHWVKCFFCGVISRVLGADLPKTLETTNDLRHLPIPRKPETHR